MATADPFIIKLPNVRLSFPHLFEPHAMEEGQEEKYSATFILSVDEHGQLIDKLEAMIDRMALDHFKKKVSFKSCLKDGADKPDIDGYGDGTFFIPASRKTRPTVVDKDPSIPLTKDDNTIYAGCYVNASIRLWVQDNKWGKRVNAELRAVQFLKDGGSFGAAPVNAEEEFDDVSGGSDGGSSRSKKEKVDESLF